MLDEDQQKVFDAVVTGKHGKLILMSGPAGCGKSEIIKAIRQKVKRIVMMAPTGQAASIISARTIHRCVGAPTRFVLNPNFGEVPLQSQRWMDPSTKFFGGKQTQALAVADWVIIDEDSMVRCDLLDWIDAALKAIRKNDMPFGGVGVLLCGDMGQAMPVAVDKDVPVLESYGYKFPFTILQSRCLNKYRPHEIKLTRIWRQKDQNEAMVLSRVRKGKQTRLDLARINQRVGPPDPRAIIISPYKEVAVHFNEKKLAQLSSRRYEFRSAKGGTMKKKAGPLPDSITLAEGCRVIVKANFTDSDGIDVVNGDQGVFLGMENNKLLVKLDRNGWTAQVSPRSTPEIKWEVGADSDGELSIDAKPIGKFVQYPIALGYAMTVHASQGATIERVHLYLPYGLPFTSSLVYVGLSRITSFSGLTINRPILDSDIWSSIYEADIHTQEELEIKI